ncbi:MAG TPA: sugar ABC transporter ATP-binding protein [Opitutaceae bacterium]|nr:sugar ABC transporter ATP-binding protein [Opitutaceae bacterium]
MVADTADSKSPLLEMRGISKRYFGVPVLREVDLTVYSGEVHALMGENGAGKSTLMKILAGIVRPEAGEMRFNEKPFAARSPGEVLRSGITLIHQELNLAPKLTVTDNIFLGAELRRWGGVLDRPRMEAIATQLLSELQAGFGARARVDSLTIAEQQLVEIARALRHRTQLLIMDEPTAALSERETVRLFALISRLRAQGTAIIYISHRMAEVQQLADRVTVLRDGALAGVLQKGEIEQDHIIRLMVGRALFDYQRRTESQQTAGRIILSAKNVRDRHRVQGVDLDVRAGEVFGLTGLVGAGRTEFARLIFGAEKLASGTIEFDAQPFNPRSPVHAVSQGIAYVPEDRKEQGLFLLLSAATNLTINLAAPTSGLGILDQARLRKEADKASSDFQVRAASLRTPARFLSGGNQQKLLLGRWLARSPKLLILDEPTRGVDIGAKREIYRLIESCAARGMAVLVISSELPEIIALCDRVAVMREGRIAGTISRSDGNDFCQESMMAFATGVRRSSPA